MTVTTCRTGCVFAEIVRLCFAPFANEVELLLLLPGRPRWSILRQLGCNSVQIDCDVVSACKCYVPEFALPIKKIALVLGSECDSRCAAIAVGTKHVCFDSIRAEVRFAFRTASPPTAPFCRMVGTLVPFELNDAGRFLSSAKTPPFRHQG